MFKNYSSEQLTRIVSAILIVLAFFGFRSEVSEKELVDATTALVVNGGLVLSFLGQLYGYFRRYFKGDVTIGGFRKL